MGEHDAATAAACQAADAAPGDARPAAWLAAQAASEDRHVDAVLWLDRAAEVRTVFLSESRDFLVLPASGSTSGQTFRYIWCFAVGT